MMSRDKQTEIEEMAKIIANANGNKQDAAYYRPDATDLYNAGYRKPPILQRKSLRRLKAKSNLHLKSITKQRENI